RVPNAVTVCVNPWLADIPRAIVIRVGEGFGSVSLAVSVRIVVCFSITEQVHGAADVDVAVDGLSARSRSREDGVIPNSYVSRTHEHADATPRVAEIRCAGEPRLATVTDWRHQR